MSDPWHYAYAMNYAYASWAGNIALLSLILVRARMSRMLRHYSLFYIYLGLCLVIAVGAIPVVLLYGVASRHYYYYFSTTNLLVPLFQFAILWDLRRRIIGNDKTPTSKLLLSLTLPVVMAAPAVLGVVAQHKVDPITRCLALLLSVQVMTCLVVGKAFRSRRGVDPGRNMYGIFAGLSLMVAFQGINFAQFLFRNETFQSFGFFVPFIYFVALIIFAHTLWSYEPMLARTETLVLGPPSDPEQLRRVNEQLQRALKSLLIPR